MEPTVRRQCGTSGFVRSVTSEHSAPDTQDDRSFASFSLPTDMVSKRNSALHDTAYTGKEELPVKIHMLHFPSGKCAMCCACHRGANRPAHSLEDSEDTSRLIEQKPKHDVEDLLRASHCEQLYSKVMSYLGIAELIEKL